MRDSPERPANRRARPAPSPYDEAPRNFDGASVLAAGVGTLTARLPDRHPEQVEPRHPQCPLTHRRGARRAGGAFAPARQRQAEWDAHACRRPCQTAMLPARQDDPVVCAGLCYNCFEHNRLGGAAYWRRSHVWSSLFGAADGSTTVAVSQDSERLLCSTLPRPRWREPRASPTFHVSDRQTV